MSIYGLTNLAILKDIGDRLRKKRLDKNMSQQQLA